MLLPGSPAWLLLQSLLIYSLVSAFTAEPRYIMYLTGQHNVVPPLSMVSDITHVALAFMPSGRFNDVKPPSSWPMFTTIDEVRRRFPSGTKVMVAIGGWGDTDGFSRGAASEDSRKTFARNIKAMVDSTGADGVDIDWEYPGGNGEDYKQTPNDQKTWEIEAYPRLLSEIRSALGPSKTMSAAVPGLPRDMLAFTNKTVPLIAETLDFINVMTYDLMNRRDTVTKHHTGISLSLDALDAYQQAGFPPSRMNLGLAFYIKWFRIDPAVHCDEETIHNDQGLPVGCKTIPLEDPLTGADLGQSGAFSWHDSVPPFLQTSYTRAMNHGTYDAYYYYNSTTSTTNIQGRGGGGGHYYLDPTSHIFWTWDTPSSIHQKIPIIVQQHQNQQRNIGGVFAWGLGEDAPAFEHLDALNEAVLRIWKTEVEGEEEERVFMRGEFFE